MLKGKNITSDPLDHDEYILLLHSRASGLPLSFFDKITAQDYLILTRGFRQSIKGGNA